MATTKHKFQQLVFNPANQKLIDFSDELQKLAKNALGVSAPAIIEQFIHAKIPPHRNKLINQAHLKNGTYEQIVSHLEWELEINGLEAPEEKQRNTVRQQAKKLNPEKPKPIYHHCKKLGHYRNQCRQLKKETEMKLTEILPVTTKVVLKTVIKQTQTPTTTKPSVMARPTVQTTEVTVNQELPTHPVRLVAKRKTPQINALLEPMQPNRPSPRNWKPKEQSQNQQQDTQINTIENVQAAA